MINILLIGLGGFIGSVSRYLLGDFVHSLLDKPVFPYGTFIVNIFGCLLIGILGGLSESRNFFDTQTRMFLFIGLLGGFTTFSSFGFETFNLAKQGAHLHALANVFLQIVLGLIAVSIGYIFAKNI